VATAFFFFLMAAFSRLDFGLNRGPMKPETEEDCLFRFLDSFLMSLEKVNPRQEIRD
jgi:hypothetical protein